MPADLLRKDALSVVCTAALLLGAGVLTILGLWAIASIGWTEIYADQWRLYVHYLELSFPGNVFALENGHRPIFPGLIRVVEMYWFDANQQLQLFCGALLALATALIFAKLAWWDEQASALTRSAAVLIAAISVFWLGNARMLLHGNESVHAYMLTTSLAGGIALILHRSRSWGKLIAACMLGFLATFSFGPGMAVFPALAIVLVLQRRFNGAAVIAAALAVTLVVYFSLPSGQGVRNSLTFSPIENLRVAVVWLMSMPVQMFAAALDPDSGRALPGPVFRLLHPIAENYEKNFGSIWIHHRPVLLVGLVVWASLLWSTWTSLFKGEYRGSLRLAGLGIAWFSIAVAIIVSLGRLEYFNAMPDQVFATRYLPWSCLFWLGVSWVVLGRPPGAPSLPRRAAVATMAPILLMALMTSRGHIAWATITGDNIRLFASALVSGVLEDGRARFGETFFEHVEFALPKVRQAGLSMFAWPEAEIQGSDWVPRTDPTHLPEVEVGNFERVENRLETMDAMRLEIRLDPSMIRGGPARLLVVDSTRKVVGLLVRMNAHAPELYQGYISTYMQNPEGLLISSLEQGDIAKLDFSVANRAE